MKSLIIGGVILVTVGMLASHAVQAQGTTYLSNLGQTTTGSMAVGSDSWLAADFRTGIDASGYLLDSVDLAMGNATGNPNSLTVMIYSAISGTAVFPGSALSTLNGSENPTAAGIYTYTPAADIFLPRWTHYYVVVTAGTTTANGAYEWSTTSTYPFDPTNGWAGGGPLYSSDGQNWHFTSGTIVQFALTATPIPEPGVLSLLGLGALSFLWHRRRTKRIR